MTILKSLLKKLKGIPEKDDSAARQVMLEKDAGKPRGLYWSGVELPLSHGTKHFLVLGATGSGKTLTFRMLMKSVLPRLQETTGERALIYDAKLDMLSILDGIVDESKFLTLNPFDARSAVWDMAADITDHVSALQLAQILFPDDKSSQPFFSESARDLLYGVVLSYLTGCASFQTA